MAVSKSFVAHALDLLAGVGPVQSRPMFGGHGLYAGGAMFGLLDDDELYLKTDDQCRGAFTDAGCKQWVYPSPKGPMPTSYYRPPDAALDSADAMVEWARLAQGAAARTAAAKAAKAKRKGPARRKPKQKVKSRSTTQTRVRSK